MIKPNAIWSPELLAEPCCPTMDEQRAVKDVAIVLLLWQLSCEKSVTAEDFYCGYRFRWFDVVVVGCYHSVAGWSSLVARWAHNPKVGGSNPPPATNQNYTFQQLTISGRRTCAESVLLRSNQSRLRAFFKYARNACLIFDNPAAKMSRIEVFAQLLT
jgi:hypothetical protein